MSLRQCCAGKTHERGMALVYVMVMLPLISMVTVGIMLSVAAQTTGVREIQAVKAFAAAEAGINHALAKLQAAGADTYAGETIILADGSTTVGTATVTVSCLEGGPLPCSGTYAGFRRVVSNGVLPVSGPQRSLTTTVMSSGMGMSLCSTGSMTVPALATIYGDVGSNSTITLQGTGASVSRIRADPPLPPYNNGTYTGSARATSTITCASGSCAPHVQGTVTPNVGAPVCPTLAVPTFSPGATNLSVPNNSTRVLNPATYYNSITVGNGTSSGGSCTSFATLEIPAGGAGTTTVVQVNRITMGTCSRMLVSGEGNIDLRIGEMSQEGLEAANYSRIGVTPSDTPAVPAPVPAGRLKITARSTAQSPSMSAIDVDGAHIISAVLLAPNGGFVYEDTCGSCAAKLYGAIQAQKIYLASNNTFTYDSSVGSVIGGTGNFRTLRAWKDQ